MTLAVVPIVVATGVGLVLLLRVRVTAARLRTHAAIAALRADLGLSADRCRVVDVPLHESLAAAFHPSRRLPRFEDVYRVHPHVLARGRRVGDDAR